jgi:hypothetical protein
MQLDLHLFADVGDRFPTAAWARGFRVSLTIANLLNDGQEVRDASGSTPLSYQRAYLAPLGRTVSLGSRKLLFELRASGRVGLVAEPKLPLVFDASEAVRLGPVE